MKEFYNEHSGYTEKDDKFYIGTIEFKYPVMYASAGGIKLRRLDTCDVYVYGGEGDIPHFHIFNENEKFHTCIQIYEAKYFLHGSNKDKLNNVQAKQLDEWLRKTNISLDLYTNWKSIERLWHVSNTHCKYPKNKMVDIQPDYTKLNEGDN